MNLLLPLFTVLGLSLIFPILIIMKWQSRPVLALATATLVCFLSIMLIYLGGAYLEGSSDRGTLDRLTSGFVGMLLFTLVFGFPILAVLQWRRRKKRKQKIRAEINDAF
jgi:O-antigen ligase